MNEIRSREEVTCILLALLTEKIGASNSAEAILSNGKCRPDAMFQLRGLRVILEGQFADAPDAEQSVYDHSRNRVRTGISHIAVAVIFPPEIRKIKQNELANELANSQLQYFVVDETSANKQWLNGNLTSLKEAIIGVQRSLSEKNITEKIAESLSNQLDNISSSWIENSEVCEHWAEILCMSLPENEKNDDNIKQKEMITKVSALVLTNAFIFQEQLSYSDERIYNLQKTKENNDLIDSISKHWEWIWKNINYAPIFQLAQKIIVKLPPISETTNSLNLLLDEAQNICKNNTALRHDLMGRIYHWLLNHSKYLGTFYTSVSSATLLLKVTFNQKWDLDFSSPREIADFKVADLACGTGTLLMATTQAITDKFLKSRLEVDKDINDNDLSILHSTLMQNIIHGYDILPSAIHLTASTLALLAPDIAFRHMNLYAMPIGCDHGRTRLGSLDFIDSEEVFTHLTLDNSHFLDSVRTSASKNLETNAKVPQLDLCVMNPPFTANRYGNKMFGNLPNERKKLLSALSTKSKKFKISLKAGLGAPFIPLADIYTKPGGRIAFVLPVALVSGESWGSIRDYISYRYNLEIVISSHDPNRWNFSENTSLSEIMFIARKLKRGERPDKTTYVSLWKNPTTTYGALDVADQISKAMKEEIDEFDATPLKAGEETIGEMTVSPAPKGQENWTNALFASSQLSSSYRKLQLQKELLIPGSQLNNQLPLCPLHKLGEIGYDVRGIMDVFEVNRNIQYSTDYSGFWDHKADQVVQLSQAPNSSLVPRKGNSSKAEKIWNTAGKILVVSRLRTTTHRVIAVGFDNKVLGNTWWAFNDSQLSETQRKTLLLWLNSTLGILSYYGRRAITEGTWMQMKKPAWENMQVLDVKSLSNKELLTLATVFDEISEERFNSISELDSDETRIKIDQIFEQILELPSLEILRKLLVREPGISDKEIYSI